MNELKKLQSDRTQIRRFFTKALNEFQDKCRSETIDINSIKTSLYKLKDKADRLFHLDEEIKTLMLADDNVKEEELNNEYDLTEEYRDKWLSSQTASEHFLAQTTYMEGSRCSSTERGESLKFQRNFNLPKLNLIEFDGNVRNWIAFWGQFKKVHNDPDLQAEDKFQYLIQATKPSSSARDLVESFPPSGENYGKAIDQLKSRFARDEFLIEFYIRELLKLVMQQATSKVSIPLCKLFDKLETQLRALETLGVTSEKYAAMLYPLVESSLPEDTLRAWERFRTSQRTPSHSNAPTVDTSIDYLQALLSFLRTEVESEERLALARSSFNCAQDDNTLENDKRRTSKVKQPEPLPKFPTAATILTTENQKGVSTCIFCTKSGHPIQECSGFHKLKFNDKRDFITKKGACFSCLRLGHTAKSCKVYVNCCICHKKHHAVMCKGANETKLNGEEPLVKPKSNNIVKGKSEVLTSQSSETLLQTLLVKVESQSGKEYFVRILLDSGSQRSYVTKDCVAKLGLSEVGGEIINHSLFGGVNMQQTAHKSYLLTLQSVNTSYRITVPVLDQDVICSHVPRLQDTECLTVLKNKGIVFTEVGEKTPDVKVLLGADIIGELYTGIIENVSNGLVAVETYLGWTVMGKQRSRKENQQHSLLNMFCVGKSSIEDLWSLETIGIKDPSEVKTESLIQAETLKHFKENVKINDEGRYEVSLPWVKGHTKPLDNRNLAEKRLLSVTKRLQKVNKFEDYDKVFKDWLADGIIEKVSEISHTSGKHYLPHHAVVKESSLTTKIRPVFDASAKDHKGICLNLCLEKGPNLVELIPPLVMKFRQHQIGITADIKKAFLQINLTAADRDYLRFLWWDDYEKRSVATFRHCRVVFGVTSSPFLLGATISHHLDSAPPEMKESAEKLKKSFYVDDCVTSVDSVSQLNRFVKESSALMNSGKFELRGWCSNVQIRESNIGDIYSGGPVAPLLGMLWDTQEDVLFCDTKQLSVTSEQVTKRSLLSVAQRIFDVVGFTSPVSLIPKLLLREAWTQRLTWDQELPNEITCKFLKWSKNLKWLEHCRIQRAISYFNATTNVTTIHVFCDASKYAYAACIFVRSKCKDKVDIQLLSAKSRIAPMKQITIPRLELLAAVIGSRLFTQAKEALKLDYKVYFWTDSTTVLTWIRVKEDWSTFVGNRCKEICQVTDKRNWHHIPGNINPADLPSRGCSARLLYESRWWEGPAWLREDEEKWPMTDLDAPDKEAFLEKKKTIVSVVVTKNYKCFTDSLTYFSKYSKLLRMIAWIIRFIHNSSPIFVSVTGELNTSEIHEAELRLIKCIQGESFQESKSSLPKNLPVFIDGYGLLRVKTRLTLSDESEDFSTPILLPSSHPIVTSLILEKHTVNQHAGVQTLLVILREHFWIIRGRKTVRNVLSKCVRCKRFKAKAGTTLFPPLPLERISECSAFHTTGIDLAGPLYLSNGKKAWTVLFTCAVYRAIHLELIESLSTDAFIAALRRFIARRGRTSIIFTDNGTNFVGTNNLLSKLDWKVIQEKYDVCKITWKFNPPSAPWWGGWWERLVRMVKELLRRNLGSASLSYEELMTLLCDCESTINSRPLTYLSDDFETLQPLTPAMFLQPIIRSDVCDLDKIDSACLNKRVRYVQRLREGLRSRFKNEYLSMLVHRTKSKQLSSGVIQIGDVVLIGDDNVKRINWPLARVLETFVGKDGLIRVVKLKTATGELIRPIQRLYPLEVRGDNLVVQKYKEKHKKEKMHERDKDEKEVVKIHEATKNKKSRKGRTIKTPQRLDL